jgi:uncharacterized membrane protein YfcA
MQELELNWNLVVVTLIGFLGSACGTVGGVGGGGIFVPMLTLIVGFDTKSAAALSKCKLPSIFWLSHSFFLPSCSSLSNMVFQWINDFQ